jgi:hypothetical protein
MNRMVTPLTTPTPFEVIDQKLAGIRDVTRRLIIRCENLQRREVELMKENQMLQDSTTILRSELRAKQAQIEALLKASSR